MDVLALSVDGLGSDSVGSMTDAKALIDKLQLPFAVGIANENLIAVLQIYHNVIFLQHRPLPIPTSILINRDGVPLVVYKGAIDLSELLADTSKLGIDAMARRDLAIPFPGRWRIPTLQVHPHRISKALHNAGWPDAALLYLQRFRDSPGG